MTSKVTKIHVQVPTGGQKVASAGNVYRYLATGTETNGKFALLESTVDPGKGAPFHTHSREEEAFIVTEGAMVFYSGNDRIEAPTGALVSCPVGTMRGFRNEGTVPAKMLILLAPAGLEKMFTMDGTVLEPGQSAEQVGGLREMACPELSVDFGIENHDIPLPDAAEVIHVHETSS